MCITDIYLNISDVWFSKCKILVQIHHVQIQFSGSLVWTAITFKHKCRWKLYRNISFSMTAFWSFSSVVHAGWLPKQMIAQDKFYFTFHSSFSKKQLIILKLRLVGKIDTGYKALKINDHCFYILTRKFIFFPDKR